jgi:uncharacterized protein YjiS (DUF1127 family)
MMRIFERLRRAAAHQWRMERARRQLYELNDHLLSDIGISRGEIDGAVRGLDLSGRRA